MRTSDRPTMIDVAADAGVSLKTVSRVINGVPSVDAALVQKVTASIERLGFRRNVMAANLRSGSRDTIGLITADLANTFYTTVASAVASVARSHGMQVIMASTDENADAERAIALDICERRVSGLILVPSSHDQSYLEAEVRAGTPVVFLDRPGRGLDADSVLIDNRGGSRVAVDELIEAGHERIALLFDSLQIYTMAERHAGAMNAFENAGRVQTELVVTDLHTPSVARAAMEQLLDLAQPPTAVFCANNRVTIGALEAILSRDSDVAVTGFDDFETARLLPRPIRIVDYDAAGLGEVAAETMLRRTLSPAADSSTFLLPTRLIDRGGLSHR